MIADLPILASKAIRLTMTPSLWSWSHDCLGTDQYLDSSGSSPVQA